MIALAIAAPAQARQAEVWNDARALELMERASERRARPVVDSLLRNYRSKAAGMVYFYLDRRDTDERTLVKSDQLAVEVYWAAPDRTRQHIVGMRGEDALPNRMYYHLDHLTVVQNEFGDVIRLGDGDEVRDVPHPAAPGADSIYDFRLADSLSIRLGGAPEPIRAYRIDVRPKRTDRSAFVGSVYVDRTTADIVRMTFTFTPASYVDRRLDYINISLDNSLWDGRYWLPHEQAVEIRRQLPELDFIAGAVIQGRFRISDYEFNLDLPSSFFAGAPVTAVSRAQRERYPFETQLYDDLVDGGLAPPPSMRELRAQAASLLRKRALSGLPPLRPSLPNASAAFRFNRAEGAYLGAGLSWVPSVRFRAELTGGWAFGAEHAAAELSARFDPNETTRLRASAYTNAARDLGIRPGMPGALNTLSTLSLGDDFTDPYYARGARLSLERRLGNWTIGLAATAEHQESASRTIHSTVFDDSSALRPVRPVDEGTMVAAHVEARRATPEFENAGWDGSLDLLAGTFDGDFFARPIAQAALNRRSTDLRTAARLRATGGLALGSPASQHLFLLGGRETLPGYGYRSFSGDAFALADLQVTRTIAAPWLGARLLATAGWTGWLDDPPADPASSLPGQPAWAAWGTTDSDGIRTSIGAGVSLFYDLFRLDLVRGLDGGEWQLIFSLAPSLWGFL